MFSSRLNWNAAPNRLSQLVSRHRATGTILDLTESNPTRAGLHYPANLLDAFDDPRILAYDAAPSGILAARQEISQADRVILTASTSEAYSWLFKLLCDPGDEILAPRPSYPLFDYLAALESVPVVQYPLVYHGAWSPDFASLEAAITPRTRAIVIVNPNNPTGSYLKLAELGELIALCARYSLPLISDEVFADYALAPDPQRVPTLAHLTAPTTFCLNGLSKLIGMPQMKLGWILTNNRKAHESLELIADTYLSVGAPVQYALPRLLEARAPIQTQIMERVRANLAFLESHFSVRKVEGGWSAILHVPRIRTEEEWTLQLLERCDVLVQPGYFYDFESEAFLILSLLTPVEIFQQGVQRLHEFAAADHS